MLGRKVFAAVMFMLSALFFYMAYYQYSQQTKIKKQERIERVNPREI